MRDLIHGIDGVHGSGKGEDDKTLVNGLLMVIERVGWDEAPAWS